MLYVIYHSWQTHRNPHHGDCNTGKGHSCKTTLNHSKPDHSCKIPLNILYSAWFKLQITRQYSLFGFEYTSKGLLEQRSPCCGASREKMNNEYAIRKMQFPICNMQYAICNIQYAICNIHYVIWNIQYPICSSFMKFKNLPPWWWRAGWRFGEVGNHQEKCHRWDCSLDV